MQRRLNKHLTNTLATALATKPATKFATKPATKFATKPVTTLATKLATTLGTALVTAIPLALAQPSEPSAEAQALIDELQLKASHSASPQADPATPKRIVVQLVPFLGLASKEYEEALQAVAGHAELVFDRSGGFVPSAELLEDADGIIGFCTEQALQRADVTLRWYHSYVVGMDHCLPRDPEQKDQVVFSNNKRLSGPAIAEHTIAMLLALSRNMPAYIRAQAEGEWRRGLSQQVTFGELKGKTLLVAGLGGIGTEIAWRAHGLGMRVIATRNSSREGPDFVDYVGLAKELPQLATQADVVVNALPLTADTTAIFDRTFFNKMKAGSIFLSVGRGKSTVTADLVAALQNNTLFGAGLDVTDPEPLAKDSPLWHMDNVIITPHVAAAGKDGTRRTQVISVENLRRYVAGEALLNVVDPGKGY